MDRPHRDTAAKCNRCRVHGAHRFAQRTKVVSPTASEIPIQLLANALQRISLSRALAAQNAHDIRSLFAQAVSKNLNKASATTCSIYRLHRHHAGAARNGYSGILTKYQEVHRNE